jgi:hypothetical protein
VTLTVSPNGTSIKDLLASGANGAPISDVDAGAVQGIAVVRADSKFGVWQYSLNGGQSWQAVGTVSLNSVRLLSSDANGDTRLRFVQSGGGTAPGSLLTFYAWDQTVGTNGGTAIPRPRGGTGAFSRESEAVSVLAPNDGSPQVTITKPLHGSTTAASALTQALGTAGDADVISSVTVRLYRYAGNGNTAGFWNGNLASPGFGASYDAVLHEHATQSSDSFANWSAALPSLQPGQYWIQATARDSQGNWSSRRNVFTVNDGSPQVSIATPEHQQSYQSSALSQAVGTASDSNGISGVTVWLYRYAGNGNTAGYWNGNLNTPEYGAGITNIPAVSANSFANWSAALPALQAGQYKIQATARDSKGNWSIRTHVFTIVAPVDPVTVEGEEFKSEVTLSSGSASASSGSIVLEFEGTAPQGAFTVSVNGTVVSAQSVERSGSTVTLLLPDGSLKAGDTVAVTWQGGSINLLAE